MSSCLPYQLNSNNTVKFDELFSYCTHVLSVTGFNEQIQNHCPPVGPQTNDSGKAC